MISEEKLRTETRAYEKLMLDCLPEPDACETSFSPKFERKMRKLIRRTDHPYRYWIQKGAACLLLAVLLCGGGLLTFSTEARAAFFGWVREVIGSYFVYSYVGENQEDLGDIVYRPTWIPNGYEKISENHGFSAFSIVYQNEEEKTITFSYFMNNVAANYQIGVDDADVQHVFVEDRSADLYAEKDGALSSVLVWTDEETGAIFDIVAALSGDEMIKMAESVERQ